MHYPEDVLNRPKLFCTEFMGVKLLSVYGNNADWGCLRMKC
jgi:hypothetical protein